MAFSLATAAVVGLTPTEVGAQGIGAEVQAGFKALKTSDWEASRTIFTKITTKLGEDGGRQQFGSKFGEIYYFQGLSELNAGHAVKALGGEANLKKADELYKKAAASFAMSYKFPSKDGKKNKFEKACLRYQAQALKDLRDYDGAVQFYEKYQAERKKADKVNPGILAINMAICYFKLDDPDFKKGISLFEVALKNKQRWKTPDAAIVKAFQALTEGAIKAENEQAILDFLNQNRAGLTLKPYQMVQFTPFFQKLGSQTMSKGMLAAAFNIFALVPDTKTALADIQVLKTALEDYPLDEFKDGSEVINKLKLDEWSKKLSELKLAGDPPEVFALVAMAFTHEKNGYVRGAMGAYENLELYYKQSEKREDNLYHLVRTASMLDEVPKTVKYGEIFLKRFPTSKHATIVSNVMLSSLFAAGDYEKSEAVSEKLIDSLEKSTAPHDVCLYVLGGSKFYLGKYSEARPLLAEHIKLYPESASRVAVAYFEASNLGRLNMQDKAAKSLDAFIAKYPDAAENAFLAYALFDRANLHYKADESNKAIKLLIRIQSEFDSLNIADATYNLTGDIYKADKKLAEAKTAYQKALERGKSSGNSNVSAEALYKLIKLVGAKGSDKKPNPTIKEAVPFYDEFWKEHTSSPYRLQVAVSGIPSLVAAGRTKEALDNLETAIGDEAKKAKPFCVQRAVEAYTKDFVASKAAEGLDEMAATDALRSKYFNFKGIAKDDVGTRAMLELEIIGLYQQNLNAAKKAKNEDLVGKNKGRIAAAFKKLKANFPLDQLTATGLMDLGDYLLKSSASPREALPYFEERLKRPEKKDRVNAEFGIAEVYSLAGSATEVRKGIDMMLKIQKERAEDKKTVATASEVLVAIYFKQENWEKVVEVATAYLSGGSKGAAKTRVTQSLAEAYFQQKNFKECIKVYNSLYSGNIRTWEISVPSLDRATDLIWKHGKSTDAKTKQQAAYEMLRSYINSSRAAFEENKIDMPADVREGWLSLDKRRQEWEASGLVVVAPAK